jgi:hypothetical protein
MNTKKVVETVAQAYMKVHKKTCPYCSDLEAKIIQHVFETLRRSKAK